MRLFNPTLSTKFPIVLALMLLTCRDENANLTSLDNAPLYERIALSQEFKTVLVAYKKLEMTSVMQLLYARTEEQRQNILYAKGLIAQRTEADLTEQDILKAFNYGKIEYLKKDYNALVNSVSDLNTRFPGLASLTEVNRTKIFSDALTKFSENYYKSNHMKDISSGRIASCDSEYSLCFNTATRNAEAAALACLSGGTAIIALGVVTLNPLIGAAGFAAGLGCQIYNDFNYNRQLASCGNQKDICNGTTSILLDPDANPRLLAFQLVQYYEATASPEVVLQTPQSELSWYAYTDEYGNVYYNW